MKEIKKAISFYDIIVNINSEFDFENQSEEFKNDTLNNKKYNTIRFKLKNAFKIVEYRKFRGPIKPVSYVLAEDSLSDILTSVYPVHIYSDNKKSKGKILNLQERTNVVKNILFKLDEILKV